MRWHHYFSDKIFAILVLKGTWNNYGWCSKMFNSNFILLADLEGMLISDRLSVLANISVHH